MVCKSPNAFRTISEVAGWLELPTHVLRFWESKITQISPIKRAGGRRYYRPRDMLLLGGIKFLLYEEGLTIRALKQKITSEGQKVIESYSQSLEKVKEQSAQENKDKIDPILIKEGYNKNKIEEHRSNLTSVDSRKSELLWAVRKKLRRTSFQQNSKNIILIELFKKLVQKRDTIAESLTNCSKTQY
jgi:DNA-binding transcriptional MerR regulator